jgi:elongation factor G
MLENRLGANPLVVQIPIGSGAEFRGVVDLVSMTALVWDAGEAMPRVTAIPAELMESARAQRRCVLEQIVELEDEALALYLKSEDAVDEPRIRRLIRTGCITGCIQPVLCGSAYRNVGVQPLLDAIVDYCPAPGDRPLVEGVNPRTGVAESRPATEAAPLAALVSKVQMSRYGALSYVRIYSGRMQRGTQVINATSGKVERIGRLLRTHANEETEIDAAIAGDVIAVVGLKSAVSGDSLSDPRAPIVLSGFSCPDPVIEAVIEPRSSADHERLGQALAAMAREDPSLRIGVDPETGQTLVRGMGELHLMIWVESLQEDYNVEATIGPPRVAYREAITARAEVDHTFRKQNGGVGQMARVHLMLEPPADGESGLLFESRVVGGAVPKKFVPAVEKALQQAMQTGVLAGYPLLGLKAALIGGAFHAKDSSSMAFELATREAFKIACARAGPVLLEPIMRVLVTTPEKYLGAVLGDLQSRRGSVLASDVKAGVHEIVASVPLANMFSYVNAVRSLSQGRTTFTMRLDRHARMPKALQAKVLDPA